MQSQISRVFLGDVPTLLPAKCAYFVGLDWPPESPNASIPSPSLSAFPFEVLPACFLYKSITHFTPQESVPREGIKKVTLFQTIVKSS